jgi:hypothetical protein
VITEERREITLQDRCDSCGAAARVVAIMTTGELLFCGHHGRVHKDALVPKAIRVYDPDGEFNLYT